MNSNPYPEFRSFCGDFKLSNHSKVIRSDLVPTISIPHIPKREIESRITNRKKLKSHGFGLHLKEMWEQLKLRTKSII